MTKATVSLHRGRSLSETHGQHAQPGLGRCAKTRRASGRADEVEVRGVGEDALRDPGRRRQLVHNLQDCELRERVCQPQAFAAQADAPFGSRGQARRARETGTSTAACGPTTLVLASARQYSNKGPTVARQSCRRRRGGRSRACEQSESQSARRITEAVQRTCRCCGARSKTDGAPRLVARRWKYGRSVATRVSGRANQTHKSWSFFGKFLAAASALIMTSSVASHSSGSGILSPTSLRFFSPSSVLCHLSGQCGSGSARTGWSGSARQNEHVREKMGTPC